MMSASLPVLLVLAWDDSDPHLHSAEAIHAPTLPQLRELATHLPLLAVLPHLPGGAELRAGSDLPGTVVEASEQIAEALSEPLAPSAPVAIPAEGNLEEHAAIAPSGLLDTGQATSPGTLLLNLASDSAENKQRVTYSSRLIGLAEAVPKMLNLPLQEALPTATARTVGQTSALSANRALMRSVRQIMLRVPLEKQQLFEKTQEPAAPYQGHSISTMLGRRVDAEYCAAVTTELIFPKQLALAGTALFKQSAQTELARLESTAIQAPSPEPEVSDISAKSISSESVDEQSEPPTLANADTFEAAQTGPAEAADLSAEAPETDISEVEEILPPTAARATLSQGLAALSAVDLEEPTPFALADDLHYRIIQYARFTAPLVASQAQEFSLIYAADWPTWLAALELRNALRCPLVLHLTALAADQAAPAERGWLLEMERYALRRAHTVIVPDLTLRKRVQAAYPNAKAVLVVAPNDTAALTTILRNIGAV